MRPQCPFCKALAYEGAISCPRCGGTFVVPAAEHAPNVQAQDPTAAPGVDLRTVNRSQLRAAQVSGLDVGHIEAGADHRALRQTEAPPAQATVQLRPVPVTNQAGAAAAAEAGHAVAAEPSTPAAVAVIASAALPDPPAQLRQGLPGVTGRAVPSRPVEVWAVMALLVGLALFLLVPALQLAYGVLPGLVGESFERAISALGLMLATMIGAVGVALLGITVLIFRSDRVGQALIGLVGAVIILGVALSPARSNSQIGVAAGCLAAIVLVTGTPAARTYFKSDDRPLGIVVTAATITYLSGLLIACGVILLPAYSLGLQYVLYAVAFIAGGALLRPVNRGLKAGTQWSRIAASMILGCLAALTLAVDHQSPQSLMTAAVCAAPVAFLWVGESVAAHFTGGGPSAEVSA